MVTNIYDPPQLDDSESDLECEACGAVDDDIITSVSKGMLNV